MEEVGIITRKPQLLGVFFRALLITFVLTLLAFAVTLLLAIIGLSLFGLVAGRRPDLANAYRYGAFPTAILVAVTVLVTALITEFKRYRQQLAAWRGF